MCRKYVWCSDAKGISDKDEIDENKKVRMNHQNCRIVEERRNLKPTLYASART
jgi:hypothetical protein